MRTTVTIDDDVLRAVRQIADSRGESLGQVLSDLARASLTQRTSSAYRNGVKLLPVGATARGVTMEEVNDLRDDPE